MKVQNILASFVLFASPMAFAATTDVVPLKTSAVEKLMADKTLEVRSTKVDAQVVEGKFMCDPPGAACFVENSETCCSKICEYQLCH